MPGRLRAREAGHAVVVVDRAVDPLLGREADVEVAVEVVARRRDPVELPAHALPEALDLGQRRARDGHERDVAVRQVHEHAVGVVGHVRAARAALLPARPEHEVLHQQLAPAVEQLGERAPALGRVEDVVLGDALPGQRAALARRSRRCRRTSSFSRASSALRSATQRSAGTTGWVAAVAAAAAASAMTVFMRRCSCSGRITGGRSWGGARRAPCRCRRRRRRTGRRRRTRGR